MRNLIIREDDLIDLSSSSLTYEKAHMYAQIATDYIENLVGISLEYGPCKEYLQGNNQRCLYLKKRPIRELVSIKINGILQNNSDFLVHKDKIKKIQGCFKQGFGIDFPYLAMKNLKNDLIEIEYIGGFIYPSNEQDGDVPWDLKLAIANLVSQLEFENSDKANLKSYKILDISYTFATQEEKSNTISAILKKYFSW